MAPKTDASTPEGRAKHLGFLANTVFSDGQRKQQNLQILCLKIYLLITSFLWWVELRSIALLTSVLRDNRRDLRMQDDPDRGTAV